MINAQQMLLTNDHKISGSKQHVSVFFQFCRSGSLTQVLLGKSQGARSLISSAVSRGEPVPHVNGNKLRAKIGSNHGDPGYKETAKMLAECALSLALEMPKCTKLTGVVSPAAGIGEPLIDRLKGSGFVCEVLVEKQADQLVREETKEL